jgi:nucleotide-binding universal stress UspA family protein
METRMRKILVAVDGSDASLHAAQRALELSQFMNAEVTLAHVTPPTLLPGDVPIAPVAELRDAELAHGAQVLEECAVALEHPELKRLNLIGATADTLCDTATEQDFDLVVVGNKGKGAVSRVLLGSVSDRLVHLCTRPVLVVR